jgi:SAM-dependent methyltransferase
MSDTKTTEVQNWWNTNPFTYNGAFGVGELADLRVQDIAYFDKAEARYIKHSGTGTQYPGNPVFSKYIDYSEMKGKKVLDIATGTGFSAVTFAKAGAEVTGIDLTDYAVASTKRNFELRELTGTILKMDAQKLEFPDNYFDFVCAHGCLMHMPDTQKAVREIHRVLKPGGKMYAWMYHRGWYYWFGIIFLRGILCGKFFTNGFSQLRLTSRYSDGLHTGGNPHTKFFSRGGFKRLFKNGGFENITVYANYNTSEWTAWPLQRFSLGAFVPKKIQKFLSETVGLSFSCSITAEKSLK